jgi:hypothetical protein
VLLRGNLHAHTTFSDGVRTPTGLVAEYERLGYDFLAITDHFDHDNLVHPDYEETLAALESELLIFRGIELSYQRLDQHVGRVHGDTETLYILNHPARYKLSVAETLDRMQAIRRAGWPLEAVEVTDTARSTTPRRFRSSRSPPTTRTGRPTSAARGSRWRRRAIATRSSAPSAPATFASASRSPSVAVPTASVVASTATTRVRLRVPRTPRKSFDSDLAWPVHPRDRFASGQWQIC